MSGSYGGAGVEHEGSPIGIAGGQRTTSQVCALCRQPVVCGHWRVFADGRVVCADHSVSTGCTWCGFPASFSLDEYQYCYECKARAITSSEQVVSLGRLLHLSLAPRSCWLANRVSLLIHSRNSLAGAGRSEPDALGMTEAVFQGGRLVHQKIWVRYGLPQEVCLMTLAHEYTHAFLNYRGQTGLIPTHLEGFCQYIAGVVAREHLGHSQPAQARYNHELTREDHYGQGMRLVADAVRRHGEAAVISAFVEGTTACLGLPAV